MKVRGQSIVYLSGTMLQDSKTHKEWREVATEELEKHGIQTLNPYRGREHSVDGKITKVGSYHYTESSSPVKNRLANMLVARDLKDVQDCDLLLVNLKGTKDQRPSIGTLSELAWAFYLHKPVVCIVDEATTQSDYYKHPFMHIFVSQWVSTVEEGVDAVVNYWHPDADRN